MCQNHHLTNRLPLLKQTNKQTKASHLLLAWKKQWAGSDLGSNLGFIFYFWIKFDSVSGLHNTAKNAYMCVWSEHLMISSGHRQICSLIHCLSYWSFCESIYEFKPIKKTCYAHWKGEQRSGTWTSDLCVFTLNLTCSQSHWIEVAVCTCVCVFNWKKPLILIVHMKCFPTAEGTARIH